MIPFATARAFVIPFGDFADQTFDQVAETDDGLRYLDNLRGYLERQQAGPGLWAKQEILLHHLTAYLDDTSIAKDLADLVDTDRERRPQRCVR